MAARRRGATFRWPTKHMKCLKELFIVLMGFSLVILTLCALPIAIFATIRFINNA
jgi:uncharacterized protein YceK